MGIQRMTQGFTRVDAVTVSTPMTAHRQQAFVLQVAYNLLHGSLSNAHFLGHIAQPGVGIVGKHEDHISVITEQLAMTQCKSLNQRQKYLLMVKYISCLTILQ
jgi:hypothetical protein